MLQQKVQSRSSMNEIHSVSHISASLDPYHAWGVCWTLLLHSKTFHITIHRTLAGHIWICAPNEYNPSTCIKCVQIDHYCFYDGDRFIYLQFSVDISRPDWKDRSMGDTTIEMASHKEPYCSVKEFRVYYRGLFFPLCCLFSSSSSKDKFFKSIKVGVFGFLKSIVFFCSSCLDLTCMWTLAVCFCPSTKCHFYQQSFPFTPVYLKVSNTPIWIVPKA